MKKRIGVLVYVVIAAWIFCIQTAFATKNDVLTAGGLYVKDSNGNVITDIRDAIKGENCNVFCVLTNNSSKDEEITVYAASFKGGRLTDVQKQSYAVAAGASKDIIMPFEWHISNIAGNEEFRVFVFSSDLTPLCSKYLIEYTNNTNRFITDECIYEEDFENGIPEEWLNSTTGYRECDIYTDSTGNKMLLLNANNSIIQTPRFLEGSTDVAITADFYQNGSTGSSISALGFGRYGLDDKASQRFMYYDVVTPGSQLRDVFGYATSASSIQADRYTYDKFSEKTGLLNTDTRITEPFSMTMGYYDGTVFCYAEDSSKSALWDYSTEVETDEFMFDEQIHQTKGFVILSHSATGYVDNLVAHKIVETDDIIIDLPDQVHINEWYELEVKAIGEGGAEYSLPLTNITFKYDKTAVEIADEKIKFLKEGEHSVLAVCNDRVTLGKGLANTTVYCLAEIDSLEISDISDAYKSGDKVTFDVKAYSDGDTVGINSYSVTCDGVPTESNQISGLGPGEHNIEVKYGNISAKKTIYISRYSSATLSVKELTVGKTYNYALNGITKDSTEKITDFTVEYDKASLSVSGENITALKPGNHKIKFNFDNVSEVIAIDAVPDAGVAVINDFEKAENKTQYFNYDTEDVVTEVGSNHVLSLKNKTTDLTIHNGLSAYTVSGKFRIEPESIDEEAYSSGFEIVTRRVTNEMFGAVNKGVHFMYNPDGDSSADMRIGTALYPEKLSENGQWHDFSATMYGKVCVFSIDGHEMVTKVSTTMTAGFYVIANNCQVMLDDIAVTRIPSSNEAIEAKVFCDTLNTYEHYAMTNIAALRRGQSNVYMNPDNITWRVPENSGMRITDDILSFDNGVKDGKYTLTAVYAGKEYPIDITLKTPEKTKVQYTMETVQARQENFAFRLSERSDELRIDFSNGELTYLPGIFAKMLIYPKLTDYSDALIWHINTAHYQDTIVGRGTDGGDFVMLQLIMAYKELYGELNATDEAWNRVKEYLTSVNYAKEGDSHTENHLLVHYATALLTAENYPQSTVSGDTASNTHKKYKEYLKNWYNKRIKRGLGEYNSAHYYFIDTYALEALYTYTTDEEIRQICYDMLNYIYADGLDNNIKDNFGGAALRTYAYKNMTTRFAGFKRMFNLGDHIIDEKYDYANLQISQSVISTYRPIELLYKQALDTQRRYENVETSETYHLPHDTDWDSLVTRYTYVTPDYVLGSKIGYIKPTAGYTVSDLNGHQEMPWSVQFGSKSSRLILGGLQSRNETSSRLYWMSSSGQNTYKLMQNKGMLVGIYELTDESKFVHYRIPKNEFETVDEQSGWIFINDGDVYLAFKPVANAYEWSNDETVSGQIKLSESEIKVTDKRSGFVLQVVDKTEYSGTYEQFKTDIMNNTNIDFVFSDTDCRLSFKGLNGSVGVDYSNGISYKDGAVYTPDIAKLHSSPYLNSVIDSGTVTLKYGDDSYVIKTTE